MSNYTKSALLSLLCLTIFSWSDSSYSKSRRKVNKHRKTKSKQYSATSSSRYGGYGLGMSTKSHGNSGSFSYVLKLSGSQQISGERQDMMDMHHSGSKSDNASFSPMTAAMIGYGLSKNINLDLMAMYMFDMGVMDPTVALSYSNQLNSRTRLIPKISASIPASEMSQDMDKMTTATASIGLLYKMRRKLDTFANLKGSYTFYNSASNSTHTDTHAMHSSNAQDHSTHDHSADDSSSMNSMSNNSNNMGGMEHSNTMHTQTNNQNNMSSMNLASTDMDSDMNMEGHSMVMKRETNRVGSDFGFTYSPLRNWQTRSTFDINRISFDDASSQWLTTLILAEVYFATNGFMDMGTSTMPMGPAAFSNVNLSEKSENLTLLPSNPAIVVGIAYGGM